MNMDDFNERLVQELEIGEADNLSSIDVLERKLGIIPNPSMDIETRLQNIEKRFGLNDPSLR